jgi:hypothetical protein
LWQALLIVSLNRLSSGKANSTLSWSGNDIAHTITLEPDYWSDALLLPPPQKQQPDQS